MSRCSIRLADSLPLHRSRAQLDAPHAPHAKRVPGLSRFGDGVLWSTMPSLTMAPIDDPRAQHDLRHRTPPEAFDVSGVALQVTSLVLGFLSSGSKAATGAAAMVSGVAWARDYLSNQRTIGRIGFLVDDLREQVAVHSARLSQLDSERARERASQPDESRNDALGRAVLETTLGADRPTVKSMATALGTQLMLAPVTWDEMTGLLKDIARVTDEDLAALRILFGRHAVLEMPDGRLSPAAQSYHVVHQDVLGDAAAAKMPADEFMAQCSRLTGFGLAMQLNFNGSYMKPDEACFRLTSRGLKVGKLLRFERRT